MGARNPSYGALNRRCRRREWLPSYASTCDYASLFHKLELKHLSSDCRLPSASVWAHAGLQGSSHIKQSTPGLRHLQDCPINIFMHGVHMLILGKGVWLLQQVVQLLQGEPLKAKLLHICPGESSRLLSAALMSCL